MTTPSLLIVFDPDTWRPTVIFPNGQTDTETAKLLDIADRMVSVLPDQVPKTGEAPAL